MKLYCVILIKELGEKNIAVLRDWLSECAGLFLKVRGSKEGVSKEKRMENVYMYSLIHHGARMESGGSMQYVLYYIVQVISVCLPSEHDLLQATAPVSLKRYVPGVDWV